MEILIDELTSGMPDLAESIRVVFRILVATLLGAIVGYERERTGKSAGLRTHMLVSLGSCIFVLSSLEAGMPTEDLSRVIQGVAAGIGFIGAGAIPPELPGEKEQGDTRIRARYKVWRQLRRESKFRTSANVCAPGKC